MSMSLGLTMKVTVDSCGEFIGRMVSFDDHFVQFKDVCVTGSIDGGTMQLNNMPTFSLSSISMEKISHKEYTELKEAHEFVSRQEELMKITTDEELHKAGFNCVGYACELLNSDDLHRLWVWHSETTNDTVLMFDEGNGHCCYERHINEGKERLLSQISVN